VRLCVTANAAEDICHFSLGIRKVVYINFKLILQLKLPVIKYRVGVRARRGFKEDLKEQYKFYLNLRVYSSCREQDVA